MSLSLTLASAGPSAEAVAAAAEEEEERLPAGQAPPVDVWAKSSECLAWAGDGQCKANEAFMAVQCAWSCHKIELAARRSRRRLHHHPPPPPPPSPLTAHHSPFTLTLTRYRRRCPRPDNYAAALAPGEMNATPNPSPNPNP